MDFRQLKWAGQQKEKEDSMRRLKTISEEFLQEEKVVGEKLVLQMLLGSWKLFAPSQYLLPSQIASFFSRLSILSHNPRQQQTEDKDLESARQMIEVVEAIDTVNSS